MYISDDDKQDYFLSVVMNWISFSKWCVTYSLHVCCVCLLFHVFRSATKGF